MKNCFSHYLLYTLNFTSNKNLLIYGNTFDQTLRWSLKITYQQSQVMWSSWK